jgi:hypothetical protein
MMPDEIAVHQLWAAWISAGAAVVQAVGAFLTIFYAIKLARDAERRAAEAERKLAAEREKGFRRVSEGPQRPVIRARRQHDSQGQQLQRDAAARGDHGAGH